MTYRRGSAGPRIRCGAFRTPLAPESILGPSAPRIPILIRWPQNPFWGLLRRGFPSSFPPNTEQILAGPRIHSGASCAEDSHPHSHRIRNKSSLAPESVLGPPAQRIPILIPTECGTNPRWPQNPFWGLLRGGFPSSFPPNAERIPRRPAARKGFRAERKRDPSPPLQERPMTYRRGSTCVRKTSSSRSVGAGVVSTASANSSSKPVWSITSWRVRPS